MKNNCFKLYPLIILIATLFMGLGYASINNISLNINGKMYAEAQQGIFITDVSYNSNANVDITASQITTYYQTMLNSSIVLSEDNNDSNISYLVTFYNKYDDDYKYIETIHDKEFYDNENITYDVISTTNTNIIKSKDYLVLKLTFKYVEGITPTTEINKLVSCLNFKFEKYINYVDYIESNRTQYINTKVVPNNNTTFEMNFSLTDLEKTNSIMGVRTADGVSPIYNLFTHNHDFSDKFQLRWDEYDTRTYIELPISENKKITITRNTDYITFTSNGHSTSLESVTESYEGVGELYIFSQNQLETEETRNSAMKLYYFKIYQDGKLIREFLPALDENNVPCLYDKVTEEYYYSETGAQFAYGDDSSYKEYIESSGTQYINTFIKADDTTNVEFVMSLNEETSQTLGIFGARDTMDINKYNLFLYKGILRWDYYLTNVNPNYNLSLTNPTFIETKAESITIGTTTTEYNYTDIFSGNQNMYLYAINTNGNTTSITSGLKIYYFKVLKDGELVLNLVPYVDENGKACFYDLVSQELFYNANTDGSDFIAG